MRPPHLIPFVFLLSFALALRPYQHHSPLIRRIISGENAHPAEFPFAVTLTAIQYNGQTTSCGGALISPTAVITAAHCVVGKTAKDPLRPQDIIISYGSIYRNHTTRVVARAVTKHPKYGKSPDPAVDIALVRIPKIKSLDQTNVDTIKIFKSQIKPGDKLRALGWGRTQQDSGSASPRLRSTRVVVAKQHECQNVLDAYALAYKVNGAFVCTDNSQTPGSSPCYGDSGSPLVAKRHGKYYLVGVTSAIYNDIEDIGENDTGECAREDGFMTYTSARFHLKFISKTAHIAVDDLV